MVQPSGPSVGSAREGNSRRAALEAVGLT